MRNKVRMLILAVAAVHLIAALSPICLAAENPPEYVVPQYATLNGISGYYGVDPQELLEYNGITRIEPGMTLKIPETSEDSPPPYIPAQRHKVLPGETPASIASRYGVSVRSLLRWNRIAGENYMSAGSTLVIPFFPMEDQPTALLRQMAVQPESEETEGHEEQTDASEEYPGEDVVSNDLTFPLYFQTDYPDLRYGDGTIKSNGCSAVSLAMMANALTGFDYSPAELAEYFGVRATNNMERLELGIRKLSLPAVKAENWHQVWDALKAGKTAIVMVHSGSSFTVSQHFLVLKGLNAEGKIMVNDSWEPNYQRWDLKEGFAKGFEQWQIVRGWDGGWIFDPEKVPEGITRYREPRVDTSQNRYPEIELSQEDEDLLAKLIWAEARGEPLEGQQAVAEVVLNRMLSERFGGSLREVVYAAGQFRGVADGQIRKAKPGQAQYQAIARALHGPNILPRNVLYFGTAPPNMDIWGGIGGHVFCYEE